MSKIEYEEFLPRVYVYKNLIKDTKSIIAKMESILYDQDHESLYFLGPLDWGVFGKLIDIKSVNSSDPNIANSSLYIEEKQIIDQLYSAFFAATDHYLAAQKLEKPDSWTIMGPSLSIYQPTTEIRGKGVFGSLAMAHHTDYEQLKAEMPGNKFALTCTMYLNDDYEGGGVDFLADGTSYLYTPKAGDVVVFPSGHPKYFSEGFTYYHGVQEIRNANKYFVRCFYQEPYAGSEEWLANQKKYGEEVWEEMEKARIMAGMKATAPELVIEIENSIQKEIDNSKECGLAEFKTKDL